LAKWDEYIDLSKKLGKGFDKIITNAIATYFNFN